MPDNPFYEKKYATSVNGGTAYLSIPAPGGKITTEDANHLLSWLELIRLQIERFRTKDNSEEYKGA